MDFVGAIQPLHCKVLHHTDSPTLSASASSAYRSISGTLRCFWNITRPELSYAAQALATHSANPSKDDVEAALHAAAYLASAAHVGLQFGPSPAGDTWGLRCEWYADTDWASCQET
jgi:alpha-ketoglutarate-dependent taurine dioxygenase